VSLELGRTPFVVAVGGAVAVTGLTSAELVEIYAGRTTAWRDGSRLRLILRSKGDSDTERLRAISPAMSQALDASLARAGITIAPTDQDAADAIESIPGAVGTTTLLLIRAEGRSLKPLALDGVVPSLKSLVDGSYPYHKQYYLVTQGPPAGATQRFLAFLKSPQGREILIRFGVQLSPALLATSLPEHR
jgi:phosphate transport system substrate-binding protein